MQHQTHHLGLGLQLVCLSGNHVCLGKSFFVHQFVELFDQFGELVLPVKLVQSSTFDAIDNRLVAFPEFDIWKVLLDVSFRFADASFDKRQHVSTGGRIQHFLLDPIAQPVQPIKRPAWIDFAHFLGGRQLSADICE